MTDRRDGGASTGSAAGRLADRTVALLEARRNSELAAMVTKQGGTPYSAPALAEITADPATLVTFLDAAVASAPDAMLFQTGVGVERLFAAIAALGRGADWRRLVERAVVFARGPKPASALRAAGLAPTHTVPLPATTAELLALLDRFDFAGQTVVVQQYGERNTELIRYLSARGARPLEVAPYVWSLPDDTGPLRRLLEAISLGHIDALAVTSRAQVRNLLAVAGEEGRADEVPAMLREQTLVASVGPVTSAALREAGITVDVEASPPKAGPLVAAIAGALADRALRR